MTTPFERWASEYLRLALPLVIGVAIIAVLLPTIANRGGALAIDDAGTPESLDQGTIDSIDGGTIGLGDESTHEALARSGNIFVARVRRVSRTEELPTSSPDHVVPITYYEVEIEETLKGDAVGRVEVRQNGGDGDFDEASGDGPLRPGARYLFVTGTRSADEGYYPIGHTGYGNILIENDRQKVRLIDEFAALIARVELEPEPRRLAPADEPTAPPSLAVSPRRGAAGSEVVLTGENLAVPEVPISWDDVTTLIGVGSVAADNTMEARVTIPRQAEAGTHTIFVEDARGERAEVAFEVTEPED